MTIPSRIFLSYRRGDTAGHVGRLHDELVRYFGRERVFMDIDGIAPGQDFLEVLEQRLEEAAVVLVVMGPRWAGPRDDGTRRIDEPRDFVRLEVARALERPATRVIPVLVDGATMPADDVLPARLAPLSRRNAFVLSDLRWKADTQALFDAMRPSVPVDTGDAATNRRTPMVLAGAALLALLMLWAPWKIDPGKRAMEAAGITSDIPVASEGRKLPTRVIREARRQLDRARSKWMNDAYLADLTVDCSGVGNNTCSLRVTYLSDTRNIGLSAWKGVGGSDEWTYSQMDGANSRAPIALDVLELEDAIEKAKGYGLTGVINRATLEMHRGTDGTDYPIWLIFPEARGSAGGDFGFCLEARRGERVSCRSFRG